MATEKEGRYNIPILTRDNHDSWFRQQRMKLRGKHVFYTCEQRVGQYAKVASVGDIAQGLEELEITDATTKQTSSIRINVDKRKKFEEDEDTALSLLFRSLTEDDQALTDEYASAFDFWAYLKSKYSQTDATTANRYMTSIQTFTYEKEGGGITASWDRLKDYRRKLVNANAGMSSTYPDEALLLILIRSLPSSYSSTVDTLNIQTTLSVDDKLKFLEEKEIRLNEETDEHGHAAFRARKYVPPHQRSSSGSSNDEGHKHTGQCYLCNRKHMARDCPYLEIAKHAVQHAIKELSYGGPLEPNRVKTPKLQNREIAKS
jgi:hypothetical protein